MTSSFQCTVYRLPFTLASASAIGYGKLKIDKALKTVNCEPKTETTRGSA